MTRSHDDIAALLGAYALDAVEADEAAVVKAHLVECPRCAAEVATYREAATLLSFSGTEAPTGLWDRIVSTMEEEPPPLRLVAAGGTGEVAGGGAVPGDALSVAAPGAIRPIGRRSVSFRVAGVAAAAVLVVVGLLVGQIVDQGNRIDELSDRLAADGIDQAILAASVHPDARQVHLQSTDRSHGVEVLMLHGRGYVVSHNLPALPPDRTYQLWALAGPNRVSLGVLGHDPARTGFAMPTSADALAVTAEPAPGAVTPSGAPLVVGEVPEGEDGNTA